MPIHPSAIVGKRAEIGKNVDIGPHCVIEDGVVIEDDTKLWHNVYVAKGTHIGKGCNIHMGVVLGHEPQDTAFCGRPSFLKIGDRNIIREHTTVHRGTREGSSTIIGNDNFIMGLCHIAHNCRLKDKITMCNSALLAGYVEVEDMAFISGNCVVHQFVRIGTLAMIGGSARVGKDVPPFMLVENDSVVTSFNVVGIKRAGLDIEDRKKIKKAFSILYRSGLNVNNAVKRIEDELASPEVNNLVHFIKTSRRGICNFMKRRDCRKEPRIFKNSTNPPIFS